MLGHQKPCEQCGTTTANARFCSRRCHGDWRAEHRPGQTRVCQSCGETFKRIGGSRERWARRRHCSTACRRDAARTAEKGCIPASSHKVGRRAYERTIGPVPEGHILTRLCGTPNCAEPRHLEPNPTSVRRIRHRALSPWGARAVLRLRATGMSLRQVAKYMGVGVTTVRRIEAGEHWAVAR